MNLTRTFLLVAVAAGCGVQHSTEADAVADTNHALRQPPSKYVTADRDLRKCLHGNGCGGWFLTDANDATAQPVYVQDLTFVTKDLASNADQLERAEPGDLILQGRTTRGLVPKFEVSAAWRALPGGAPRKGDLLYALQDGGGTCAGLWCQPKSVVALNDTQATDVEDFGLALAQGVHRPWVDDRVAQGRVLALGQLGKGSSFDAFSGSRVFLRLPERSDCPQIKPPACGATSKPAQVATFALDANRCLFFAQCALPGPCPEFLVQPTCAPGYVAREFATAPNACVQLTCDPAWAE